MNIFETILLIVIILAAMFYLIRGIIRIGKGDTSCIFCSSCKLDEKTEDSQNKKNDSSCAACKEKCDNKPE